MCSIVDMDVDDICIPKKESIASYSCEEIVYNGCDEATNTSSAEICRSNKRKAPDIQPHCTNEPVNKRQKCEILDLTTETESILTTKGAQDTSNTMVVFGGTEVIQFQDGYSQLSMPPLKPCHYYCKGKECKKGDKCRFQHDGDKREKFLATASERARKGLQRAEAMEMNSTPEMAEPLFAVLVSGFGEEYEQGSPKVTGRFKEFMPARVKWSTQFLADERQKLQDKYSLPEAFFRMSFSTAEDQRNAIIWRNGKAVGFRGPRILVQKYIPRHEQREMSGDGSVTGFEDKAQRFLKSKAEMFHRKIQSEEEERNRNYRLKVAFDGIGNITRLRGVRDNDRDVDIEWDIDDVESDNKNERPQLIVNDVGEMVHFETVDD